MPKTKTYVIIGGVAGGASTAARLRRLDEKARIIMIERGGFVSFANCGIPYYLGRVIPKREHLLIRTPQSFWIRDRIEVLINTTVTQINRQSKTITIQKQDNSTDSFTNDSTNNSTDNINYDKLVLAQGAEPFVPPITGADKKHVYTVRNIEDTDKIDQKISNAKSAVVIGGGFIGVEMAENLKLRGLQVSILEKAPRLLLPFEAEIASHCQDALSKADIKVHTNVDITSIEDTQVTTQKHGDFPADLIIMATSTRPENSLAKIAGLQLGLSGGIQVNEYLQTSDQDIYAVGDMIETTHRACNQKMIIPLAGPASRQGRIVASNIAGMKKKYPGSLGSSVIKVHDTTAATTGITSELAQKLNIPIFSVTYFGFNHVTYYPGCSSLLLKVNFHTKTGQVLGASASGIKDVEKRIDVIATAIAAKMTANDLEDLDLCYAPPFNGPVDPVNRAGYIATNIMNGLTKETSWENIDETTYLLDVREPSEFKKFNVPHSINIPLGTLRDRLNEVPTDKDIYVFCLSGLRAYLAQRILMQNGFKEVYNISGGVKLYSFFSNR